MSVNRGRKLLKKYKYKFGGSTGATSNTPAAVEGEGVEGEEGVEAEGVEAEGVEAEGVEEEGTLISTPSGSTVAESEDIISIHNLKPVPDSSSDEY